jgi:hypothetical protein
MLNYGDNVDAQILSAHMQRMDQILGVEEFSKIQARQKIWDMGRLGKILNMVGMNLPYDTTTTRNK